MDRRRSVLLYLLVLIIPLAVWSLGWVRGKARLDEALRSWRRVVAHDAPARNAGATRLGTITDEGHTWVARQEDVFIEANRWIEQQIESRRSTASPPPESVGTYLRESSELLEQLPDLFFPQGGSGTHESAARFDLIHHLRLHELLLAEALMAEAEGRPADAWDGVLRAARMTDALASRGDLLSQLMVTTEGMAVTGIARKLSAPAPEEMHLWLSRTTLRQARAAVTQEGTRLAAALEKAGNTELLDALSGSTADGGFERRFESTLVAPLLLHRASRRVTAFQEALGLLDAGSLCGNQSANRTLPTLLHHLVEKQRLLLLHRAGTSKVLDARAARRASGSWPDDRDDEDIPCGRAWRYATREGVATVELVDEPPARLPGIANLPTKIVLTD